MRGSTSTSSRTPRTGARRSSPRVDIIRTVNSKNVKFLYCAPHTYYFGDDTKAMLRECADVLAHVHVGDTFNHKASSGLRYILNPPGTQARVHQHLNIGQGEVPWEDFFGTLAEVGFDGIMTACVFAWEDRADESGTFMRSEMQRYVDKYCVRNDAWQRHTALGAALTTRSCTEIGRDERPKHRKDYENAQRRETDRSPPALGNGRRGRTGQVGYKHRTGALRDNTAYQMVCGAFDLDFERGKEFWREPRDRRGSALS